MNGFDCFLLHSASASHPEFLALTTVATKRENDVVLSHRFRAETPHAKLPCHIFSPHERFSRDSFKWNPFSLTFGGNTVLHSREYSAPQSFCTTVAIQFLSSCLAHTASHMASDVQVHSCAPGAVFRFIFQCLSTTFPIWRTPVHTLSPFSTKTRTG